MYVNLVKDCATCSTSSMIFACTKLLFFLVFCKYMRLKLNQFILRLFLPNADIKQRICCTNRLLFRKPEKPLQSHSMDVEKPLQSHSMVVEKPLQSHSMDVSNLWNVSKGTPTSTIFERRKTAFNRILAPVHYCRTVENEEADRF
jgi:hypothetical protein